MARKHGRIHTDAWRDEDWTRLTADAQRLYGTAPCAAIVRTTRGGVEVKPTKRHAKDRATVRTAEGIEATLLFVTGPRGRRARILMGGRHLDYPKDALEVVER